MPQVTDRVCLLKKNSDFLGSPRIRQVLRCTGLGSIRSRRIHPEEKAVERESFLDHSKFHNLRILGEVTPEINLQGVP